MANGGANIGSPHDYNGYCRSEFEKVHMSVYNNRPVNNKRLGSDLKLALEASGIVETDIGLADACQNPVDAKFLGEQRKFENALASFENGDSSEKNKADSTGKEVRSNQIENSVKSESRAVQKAL